MILMIWSTGIRLEEMSGVKRKVYSFISGVCTLIGSCAVANDQAPFDAFKGVISVPESSNAGSDGLETVILTSSTLAPTLSELEEKSMSRDAGIE